MDSPAPIVTSILDNYVIVVFNWKPVGKKRKLTMGIVLIEWLDFEDEKNWKEAT
jgi:hypothetical protein